MNKLILIGIFMTMLVVVMPAMATHSCNPGEEWRDATYGSCVSCPTERVCEHIYFWKANDFRNLGDCVSHYVHSHHKTQNEAELTCKSFVDSNCHNKYVCHSSGYVSCGCYKERQIITPAGCVAVSCPAIPCETGSHCVGSQCVPDVCGVDFQCETGFECIDNQCVPIYIDPCEDVVCEDYQICYQGECIGEPTDPCDRIQCEDGYGCINGECVKLPEIKSASDNPYTESVCNDLLSNQYPMKGIVSLGLPRLNADASMISAQFKYDSWFDCVYIKTYTKGEASYSSECDTVEWWGREQIAPHSYGGMPSVTVYNVAEAICFGYAKNVPDEFTLPVTITITDSDGFVKQLVSTEPTGEVCYSLKEDYRSCRLAGFYLPFSPWSK